MAKYYFNYPFLKIKNRHAETCRFLVGEDGFEPSKRRRNRFTVCPLWPLGNSPIFSCKNGAGRRIRTPDLLITNHCSKRISCTYPVYCSIQIIKERSNNITDVMRFVKQASEAFFESGKSAEKRGYDTVSHPSATAYEKFHARERIGLLTYRPDKEKTALHIAYKAAFCQCFLLSVRGCDTVSYPLTTPVNPAGCLPDKAYFDALAENDAWSAYGWKE